MGAHLAYHRRPHRVPHFFNADAVVSLRFSTSMIMGGAAELLAYGTAVIVE